MQLEIAQIEQEFNQWRKIRRNSREEIPQDLLYKARKLYPAYKKSMICERLKLSDKKLKQILDSAEEPKDTPFNPFVIAKMPVAPELSTELSAELPALPEAFAEFVLKTSDRELGIKIPCAYLSQCFAHLGGLL